MKRRDMRRLSGAKEDIAVSAATYERLKAFAVRNGASIALVADEAINIALDKAGAK